MDAGRASMKIETTEVQAAVPELEPLHDPSGEDLEQMMSALGYDALHDGPWQDRIDRGAQMKRSKLYWNFQAMGKHGELFVHRDTSGRIIGLIGLRADPEKGIGHVALLRSATRERAQAAIVENLLRAAERCLRQAPFNCSRAAIEGSNPSDYVRMAARHIDNGNFYEVVEEKKGEADGETPRHSLEAPY